MTNRLTIWLSVCGYCSQMKAPRTARTVSRRNSELLDQFTGVIMSTLYQLYKHKEKNGTGTSVNKTYVVPLSELYVEPGFNVREIDQDHVNEFRDAFIAGEYLPPLAVQVTEKGIRFWMVTTAITAHLPPQKRGTRSCALSVRTLSARMLTVSPSWLHHPRVSLSHRLNVALPICG